MEYEVIDQIKMLIFRVFIGVVGEVAAAKSVQFNNTQHTHSRLPSSLFFTAKRRNRRVGVFDECARFCTSLRAIAFYWNRCHKNE